MLYTVSDFLNTYAGSVRLLAGQGGLARSVREVGILDYELVPGLKSHYQRRNFYEGQLVLSTFLYARDDAYQVTEAVRYLVSVGASGLVIKNVFHLEIPDSALRYANARNLPLLLVTKDDLFFDEVILDVGTSVRDLASFDFSQRQVDAILGSDDPTHVRELALGLNPSFAEDLFVVYAPLDDVLSQADLAAYEARYQASEVAGPRNALCAYDGGLLLVESAGSLGASDAERTVAVLRSQVLEHEVSDPIGVGEVHHDLSELAIALGEALAAASLARRRGGGVVHHADLGILRAILPHAGSRSMRAFERDVLGPLRDFDAENNARLVDTLHQYLGCGRSLGATAEALGAHPNTVRYRLGQVACVTGLDWRAPDQMEQLSLACAIEAARGLSGE